MYLKWLVFAVQIVEVFGVDVTGDPILIVALFID